MKKNVCSKDDGGFVARRRRGRNASIGAFRQVFQQFFLLGVTFRNFSKSTTDKGCANFYRAIQIIDSRR